MPHTAASKYSIFRRNPIVSRKKCFINVRKTIAVCRNLARFSAQIAMEIERARAQCSFPSTRLHQAYT